MRSKMITVALLATAAVSISGCKRAATGQVVAVVNGEEVSLSELNSELQNAPQGGDKNALRAAALQNLINRKLMVQQAHDRGIDKDPEFLQRQRRMNDELMISMLGNQVTKNVPVPSQSDIDQYIAAHPDMFGGRTIYPADQIVFAQPENPARLKALEADHTLDAVAARLTQMGIQFARQKGQLDTAATPPELLAQIKRLPAGEPFVLAANGRVIVSVLGAPQVQPINGDQARRIAAEAIRRQAVSDIAKKQVEQARAAAKIDYQPGFAPTDAKGGAAKK